MKSPTVISYSLLSTDHNINTFVNHLVIRLLWLFVIACFL